MALNWTAKAAISALVTILVGTTTLMKSMERGDLAKDIEAASAAKEPTVEGGITDIFLSPFRALGKGAGNDTAITNHTQAGIYLCYALHQTMPWIVGPNVKDPLVLTPCVVVITAMTLLPTFAMILVLELALIKGKTIGGRFARRLLTGGTGTMAT